MLPLHVTPTASSSKGKVTCTCGRNFKTDRALQQHQRDSPLHQNIAGESSGIKCPCGKTVKDENGLMEHIRDSSGHKKFEEFTAGAQQRMTVGHIPETSRGEKTADCHQQKAKFPEARQYVNFRNNEIFPIFAGLPGENDINLTFYDAADGFSYMPRKHWCFLAEIIDIESLFRVKLIVQDKGGATLPVAFHTDGRGTEFAPSQLQSGYTVAILYAHRHSFLDLTIGIRQEEYCGVKFFPAALAELLGLSDRVQQYSTEIDGERACHGCDEKKASLQKCSKCSLFWYCNKSCQTIGWNNKGHKRDCKLIRDDDLQAMFLMDWGHFDGFVKFPLCDLDAFKTAENVRQLSEHIDRNSGEKGECIVGLEDLLKGLDFDSMADSGPADQIEDLGGGSLGDGARVTGCGRTGGDQKARELEEIQKRTERQKEATREKAAARAKEATRRMTSSAKPSEGRLEESRPDEQTRQHTSQETSTADENALIQRCLRSAIPSIAATTGTDILELINLDILNGHLGLNIDLSDAWQRLLTPEALSENIEVFLGECATDPYAWSILKREGHFKLNLWGIIRAYEEDENRRGPSRETLIGILGTLAEALGKVVEWEIVPDHVPRAVMRMAIAVAKDGPDPPGIDLGHEDFQIDPFLAMIAEKSESSLFGTPDTENPRYWDFWMSRGGRGSDSS